MVEPARLAARAPAEPLLRGRVLPVLLAVGAILFVDNVDVSALTVALPSMAYELGGELGSMQSVMTAYFVSSASFFLLAGFLGDRLGIRDTLTLGVALIVVSSLCGALAASLLAVVVWRFVQGIGYALTFSMMMLLMKRLLPPGQQNVGMGIFMGVAMLSSMSGPVIGSVMTQHFGWRSLFFVNVLLCAPCVWVLLRNLRGGPEHPPLALPRSDRPGLQLAANLVFAVGVLGGMTVLMQLGAGPSGGALPPGLWPWLLGIAALCAVTFVALNRRLPRPILSRAIFDNRRFLAVVAIRVLLQAVSYSCLFWLPIFLQLGLGLGVVDAGLILTVFTATAAAGSFAAGVLAERLGQDRVALLGHGLVLLGVAALLLGRPEDSWYGLLGGLALLGAGFSAVFTVVNAALLAAIERGPEGMLVGSYYTVSYIAGSLGIAATSFVAAQADASGYLAATTALAGCWLVGTAASLIISRVFPITSPSLAARNTSCP